MTATAFGIKSGAASTVTTPCLIVGVYAKRGLSDVAKALDQSSKGALAKAVRRSDLTGEAGQSLLLLDLPGITSERVLLVGLGKRPELRPSVIEAAAHAAVRRLVAAKVRTAVSTLQWEFSDDRATFYRACRAHTAGVALAQYKFTSCKPSASAPGALKRLDLLVPDRGLAAIARKALAHGDALAKGMSLTKELADLPGNICTPSYLADQARKLARGAGKLKARVLSEKDMEKLGMGALLSVSRGSREPAKLIVLEYQGADPKQKPIALVGKGLTFDAGGISIKPAANMDEMKYDMCGGASVFGTIAACVEMDLPINVVGVVPSSENLPDGDANKPGDIVTSMSGQTIEVLNTDAEGRLILCDALTYTERFNPAAVIDLATLTGACIIALGNQASGLLANDDRLADDILAAGQATGDRAWRLPLWDEYQKQLDSNFADMANIGGRGAGTITAACFLSRYTRKFKWAHLDIAGTAWISGGKEKGATGRPVPLLFDFLLKRCKLAE